MRLLLLLLPLLRRLCGCGCSQRLWQHLVASPTTATTAAAPTLAPHAVLRGDVASSPPSSSPSLCLSLCLLTKPRLLLLLLLLLLCCALLGILVVHPLPSRLLFPQLPTYLLFGGVWLQILQTAQVSLRMQNLPALPPSYFLTNLARV